MPTKESVRYFGEQLKGLFSALLAAQQAREREKFLTNAFQTNPAGEMIDIPSVGTGVGPSMPFQVPSQGYETTPNFQAILSGLLNPSTQGAASNLMQGLALMPKIQDPGGLREFRAKEGIRTGFNVQEAQEKAKIPLLQPKGSPRYYRDEGGNVRFGIPPETGTTPYDKPSEGTEPDRTLVRQNKQIFGELERKKKGLEARILAKYAGKINLDKILSGEAQIPTEPIKKWDSLGQEMIDTGETAPDKLVLDWLDIIAQHESEMKSQGIPFIPAGEKKGVSVPKELDEATARAILQEAGGNKERARQLARQRGYKF